MEHCLRLCQEYGIIDAASFLLERVGEVGSAMNLILSSLGAKFVMLDAEIQKASAHTIVDNLDAFLKKKVVFPKSEFVFLIQLLHIWSHL